MKPILKCSAVAFAVVCVLALRTARSANCPTGSMTTGRCSAWRLCPILCREDSLFGIDWVCEDDVLVTYCRTSLLYTDYKCGYTGSQACCLAQAHSNEDPDECGEGEETGVYDILVEPDTCDNSNACIIPL